MIITRTDREDGTKYNTTLKRAKNALEVAGYYKSGTVDALISQGSNFYLASPSAYYNFRIECKECKSYGIVE